MSLGKPNDWAHRLLDTLGHQDPKVQELEATVAAMRRSAACIEFTPDGTVIDANDLFLEALGYRIDEIRGQHHRMFLRPEERDSAEYRDFWPALARGEAQVGRFRRVGRSGHSIWLEASYNVLTGADGKPYKVVKFATDITPAINTMMGEISEFATLIGTA